MDRRRLLMNAFSFPDNYLFKEGKGFKEKIDHYIYDLRGANGFVNEDEILINSANNYSGFILLSNSIEWSSNIDPDKATLKSNSFDLRPYNEIVVEMACYSNSLSPHSIVIINEDRINGNGSPIEKFGISGAMVSSGVFDAGEDYFDTTKTRQEYTLDISDIDFGTIGIRTGSNKTFSNTIYNIWLE